MAEEKENQEAAQEEKKESGGSKLLLIVIIVLLLILLIVGGLVAYFLLSGNDDTQADNPKQPQKVEKKKKVADMTQIGPIYPLDQFIVNLVSNNSSRYLKCKIDLELDAPELQQEVDKKLPAIRDLIIRILSSKTVEEIQTSKGKEKLKEEIKRKINEMLTTGEIRHVYFTDFVIQ